METIPTQCQEMFAQLNWNRNCGAVIYTGGRKRMYHVVPEYSGHSKFEDGVVKYSMAIMFTPNTKARTRFYVALDPNDTYSVFFVKHGNKENTLLDSASDIYCDTLQECVERMYDEYIKKFQDGQIFLGG